MQNNATCSGQTCGGSRVAALMTMSLRAAHTLHDRVRRPWMCTGFIAELGSALGQPGLYPVMAAFLEAAGLGEGDAQTMLGKGTVSRPKLPGALSPRTWQTRRGFFRVPSPFPWKASALGIMLPPSCPLFRGDKPQDWW